MADTREARMHVRRWVDAIVLTGALFYVMWTLGWISFVTGETSTPVYMAAWLGEFAILYHVHNAWVRVIKGGASA